MRTKIDSGRSLRVLHVDDDEAFGSLVADALERESESATVESVTSPAAALDRLAEETYDCVVSDYDMPERDGIEFLRAVRERFGDLPFVLFTGRGSEEVASEAISAGVTDYVQKDPGSTQFTVLWNRVENAVEGYRAERAVERTEEQYRRLIEASTDVVATVDGDGVVGYCSPAVERVLGYDPEAVVGHSFDEFLHPDAADTVARAFDRFLGRGGENGTETDTDGSGDRDTSGPDASDIDGQVTNSGGVDGRVVNRIDHAETGDGVETFTVECRVQHADGQWRWAELRVRDLRDDPLVDALVVYARDVTSRRRRERRLAALFERTRDVVRSDDRTELAASVVDAAADVVGLSVAAVYVPDGDVLDPVVTTDAAEDLLDPVPPLSVDDSVVGHVHRTGEAVFRDDVRDHEAVANPETPIRSELVLPVDGLGVFVAGSPDATAIGETERVLARLLVSTAEAVVDRFEREATIREREEKLAELQRRTEQFLNADDPREAASVAVDAAREAVGLPLTGVHLLDAEGNRLMPTAVDDAVVEKLGSKPVHERNAEPGTASALIWEHFDSGESLVVSDLREHVEADTTLATTSTPSVMLQPLGDHGVAIVSSTEPDAYDETDRLLFELLADTLTATLDRLERERELAERNRRLERQHDRLDEFVSIVGHDLRTPLETIRGSLELVAETDDPDDLRRARAAADRAGRLVDDLTELAVRGDRVDDREPTPVLELAEQCWLTVGDGEATLETHGSVTVAAAPDRLRRLLENLIGNAVEHAGEAPTVTVGALDSADETDGGSVPADGADTATGFYVADDGDGIEGDPDTVFERGYTTADEGTGLGLTIVREIAAAHGWQVRATESTSGGARFEVWFDPTESVESADED
ncbi:response regulator [Halobaculum sp. MBLA0147]|uniref:response regulator n=1 Tax=Halobaculum sp. MBLA0147 TaxID=3079934 RepID=UPI0035243D56